MKFIVQGQGGVKCHLLFQDSELNNEVFHYAVSKHSYEAKRGSLFYFPRIDKESEILVGLGEEESISLDDLREIFFKVGMLLSEKNETEVEILVPKLNGLCHRRLAEAISEGFIQSTYRFDCFRSDRKELKEITVNYQTTAYGKEAKINHAIARTQSYMDAVFFARDLVNLPANHIYPETLAQRAKEVLEPLGVKVTIYEEEAIESLGMEAYLSVARASTQKPRFIVMEYNGDPYSDYKTALVGKGLTYDSGGYSIKPSNGMETMFCDMGGAGTVIGTMMALAKTRARSNVMGFVAAAENMIAGNGYKPGDIIGSMSGKTIEVGNTDAEGRLTLADAVYYATEVVGCDRIIDLATLTGACLVALGEDHTGAVTNDEAFLAELMEAAQQAGEPIWELPHNDFYARLNDSKVADIKNIGGRYAGTITAGLFVGSFVKKDTPWIHLDIAGTAYRSSARSYLPVGATGVHVKTLLELLSSVSCKDFG